MLHHATSSHTSMTYYVYHCNICLNIASCNRPLCRTCESLQGMTAATWPRHNVAVSLTREIQELHVRYLRKQQTKALCSWHRLSHRFSICTVAHRGPAANSLKLLEPRQNRRNQADFKRSVLKNRGKSVQIESKSSKSRQISRFGPHPAAEGLSPDQPAPSNAIKAPEPIFTQELKNHESVNESRRST